MKSIKGKDREVVFYGVFGLAIIALALLMTLLMPLFEKKGVCTAKADSKVLLAVVEKKLGGLDLLLTDSFDYQKISNQEKLFVAYFSFKDQMIIPQEKIENYVQDSLGNSVVFHEDIKDGTSEVIVLYEKDHQQYRVLKKENAIHLAGTFLLNYHHESNQYDLVVTKIFEHDHDYYASYEDALKKEQVLFRMDQEDFDLENYLQEHQELLQEQVNRYQYTFEKEKGQFILKNVKIVD